VTSQPQRLPYQGNGLFTDQLEQVVESKVLQGVCPSCAGHVPRGISGFVLGDQVDDIGLRTMTSTNRQTRGL